MKMTMKKGLVMKAVLHDGQNRLVLRGLPNGVTSFEEYGLRTRLKRVYDALLLKPVFSWLVARPLVFVLVLSIASFTIIPLALLVAVAVGWGLIQAFLELPIAFLVLMTPPVIAFFLARKYVLGEDNYRFNYGKGMLFDLVNLPESLLWDMSEDLNVLNELNAQIQEGSAVLSELNPADSLFQSVSDHTQMIVAQRNELWKRLDSYGNMVEDFTETTILPVVSDYNEKHEERAFAFLAGK